jgi:AcrR family transcriptional regulator
VIGPGLVSRKDDSDSRSRILTAAAMLFSDRGYASTSLKRIANHVGMTPPALYWYFSSKQAILHELLRSTLVDFIEDVEMQVVGPSPEDKLRQFVRAHVLKTLEQPGIGPHEAPFGLRQLAQHLGDKERRDLAISQRRHLDLLRDTLREGMAAGCFRAVEVTATAFAIVSMCDYLNGWWKQGGPMTADELAAHYEDLIMRMIRAEPR